MKTKEFTVEKALWWARGLLVNEDKNKPNVSCTICTLKAEDALTTPFYEDAPISAMTDYFEKKQCEIDCPFNVVMTVNTKNGEEHVYSVKIYAINFATKDSDDIFNEIIRPTAIKLVKQATNEMKFKKVVSVTAYVEELDSSEE